MKHSTFSLTLLAAALATSILPTPARAEVEVSFDFFQENLSPHGEWIEVGGYGNAWRPTGVDDDWSPYTDGYWAYTDAGWTWVSYEDWGGITYHYGRWTRVSGEGWCWVPGYEWGPAWVSWRSNDDHIGWAPLPPEASWRPSVGFSVWVDNSYDIGPDYYRFCRTRDFSSPVIREVCLPRSENVVIINKTVNITNITYNTRNTVIHNGGPNYRDINRVSNRQVPTLKLVRDNKIADFKGRKGRGINARQEGNQLAVYAPKVKEPKNRDEIRVKPVRVVGKDKVNRGWDRVGDEPTKKELRQKMQQEAKGLTADTAPARPVNDEDLAVIPEKADPTAESPAALGKGRGKNRGQGAGNVAADDGKPDRKGNGNVAQPGTNAQENERPGKNGREKPAKEEKDRPAVVAQPTDTGRQPGLKPFNEGAQDKPERQGQANRDKNDKPDRGPQAQPNDNAVSAAEKEARREQRQQAQQQEKQQQERQQQQKANREAEEGRQQRQAEAAREQKQEQQQENAKRQAERQRPQENANRAAEARRQQQQQEEQAFERAKEQRRQQNQQNQENARRQQQAVENQRAAQQQRQAQMQREAQQQRQAQQPQRQNQAQRQYQQPPQQARQRQQQPQPQPQTQPQGGGGGNRKGEGKKRELTAEEAAKMQRQGRF